MSRRILAVIAGVLICAVAAVAQNAPQKGKFKKIDADKGIVTITADDKDRELALTDDTKMPGVPAKEVKDRLKTFK